MGDGGVASAERATEFCYRRFKDSMGTASDVTFHARSMD